MGATFSERQRDTGSDRLDTGDGVGWGGGRCVPVVMALPFSDTTHRNSDSGDTGVGEGGSVITALVFFEKTRHRQRHAVVALALETGSNRVETGGVLSC